MGGEGSQVQSLPDVAQHPLSRPDGDSRWWQVEKTPPPDLSEFCRVSSSSFPDVAFSSTTPVHLCAPPWVSAESLAHPELPSLGPHFPVLQTLFLIFPGQSWVPRGCTPVLVSIALSFPSCAELGTKQALGTCWLINGGGGLGGRREMRSESDIGAHFLQ